MKNLITSIIFFIAAAGTTILATPILNTLQTTTESAQPSDEYQRIEADELPAKVVEAIIRDYPTSTLKEAYSNNKGYYKLVMALDNGNETTVKIDKNGNWMK